MIVEIICAVVPMVGTALLCWWDPAGLVDAKYGPRKGAD